MTQHNCKPDEEWLEALFKGGKSPHTIAAYRRALAHFLHWHETAYAGLTFDLATILPRDIRDWKSQQGQVIAGGRNAAVEYCTKNFYCEVN